MKIGRNYYENVQSPETHYFDNFMNDLTEGNDEKKLLYYEAMGVAISNIPGYKMKKAFIQVGPGNTGKSKLKVMLFNLIGKQNCSAIDLQQLETPFGKSELFNKRLVGTNDLNFFQIATLDTFKQATGGDYINVQFKFENSFNMLFSGLLWFCGNRLPKFGGDKGEWVYDRFIIIKCDNVIPEEKRDADLVEHLLEEKDYIISLAIKGLKKVIDNGYKYDIPEECELAKSEFITDNDSFLSFYGECIIERDPDETIQDYCTRGKIFEVYRAWCRDNNKNHFNTKKEVKQILEKMGKAETIHAHGGQIYYKYITLNHDTNMEYSDICPRPPEDPKTSYFTAEDLGIETPDYNFK